MFPTVRLLALSRPLCRRLPSEGKGPHLILPIIERIKTGMRTGYSLLIDEYVDAALAEPADCDALRICCPVCREPVAQETEAGAPRFRHVAPQFPFFEAECESRASDFDQDYCHQHNTRARRRRLEFLHSDPFIELLEKDPLGPPYNEGGGIWEVTPRLLFMGVGALSHFPDWHRRFILRPSRERFKDPIEFFASAGNYLRSSDEKVPDVPESGLRRQVHFQIAFDLMQSFATQEDLSDNYDWLFVHAFRICLGHWASVSEMGTNNSTEPEFVDEDMQEHAAAASILGCCALDLMSDDKKAVDKAIKTLAQIETKPPIMNDRIPFLLFFGAEIAGEMERTLCRLPYLPLLRRYNRPCRPFLA